MDRARLYLLQNFDILMTLKRYWPVIDAALSLISAFSCHEKVLIENKLVSYGQLRSF